MHGNAVYMVADFWKTLNFHSTVSLRKWKLMRRKEISGV